MPTETPTEIIEIVDEIPFELISGLDYIKNNESYNNVRNKINQNFEFTKNFIIQQLGI